MPLEGDELERILGAERTRHEAFAQEQSERYERLVSESREHYERIAAESRDHYERIAEDSREHYERLHGEMREFMRDMLARFDRTLRENSQALRALVDEVRDLGAESRSHRQALLRIFDRLDRLDSGGSSAA